MQCFSSTVKPADLFLYPYLHRLFHSVVKWILISLATEPRKVQHGIQFPSEDLANTLHSRSLYHSPTMNMQTTLIPPCSDHGCFASSKPLEPIAGHSASALTWDAAACESLFLHYFCISEPSINKYWKRKYYYFFPLRFLNESQFCIQNRAVQLHHQFSTVFVVARRGSTLKHNNDLNVNKLPWKNDGHFQSTNNSWHEIRGEKRRYFTPFRASLSIPLQPLRIHVCQVCNHQLV